MSKREPSFLAKYSTAKIGLCALALILFAFLIAVYPTIRFVRGFTTGTLHPVAEFESGEFFEFHDTDPISAYYISMSVSSRDAQLPEMDLSVSNSQGIIEGDPINRWNSVMGREYKQFLIIPEQSDGKLTIEINTPENEDFLIYRKIEDVIAHELDRAKLLWIVALVPLVCALGLLLIVLVRAINSSSRVELYVSPK
ncbi:MAG: hypothetical protein P1U42_05820 [Phycisphaerales bacterium]|nr:hypothetical protein [Phycisphaerales bacterium]